MVRRHRPDAADRRPARLPARSAQSAELEAVRREVRATVAQQFYRVLTLQQRIEVETRAPGLFEQTATAAFRNLDGQSNTLSELQRDLAIDRFVFEQQNSAGPIVAGQNLLYRIPWVRTRREKASLHGSSSTAP
jgi:hypothetical protein